MTILTLQYWTIIETSNSIFFQKLNHYYFISVENQLTVFSFLCFVFPSADVQTTN